MPVCVHETHHGQQRAQLSRLPMLDFNQVHPRMHRSHVWIPTPVADHQEGASPALSLVGNRIRTAGGVGHRAPFPGSLQARKETHPSLGPLPTYFSGSPTSIEKNVLNARQVAASKLGQAAGSRRLLCQLPWLNFGRRTARCEPTSLR